MAPPGNPGRPVQKHGFTPYGLPCSGSPPPSREREDFLSSALLIRGMEPPSLSSACH